MGIRWTDVQLKQAGIDKKKLASLLKKFAAVGKELAALNLMVYGSDGSGYLIHKSRPEHTRDGKADTGAVVADIGFGFGGGGW